MPTATTVFVCRECKHHRPLVRFLNKNAVVDIREVGCQKVCEEPVCGLRIDGSINWFAKMDTSKRQNALAAYLIGAKTKLPDALKKARTKKRSKSPR